MFGGTMGLLGAAATTVSASGWMALAGVGSVVTGVVFTLVRMRHGTRGWLPVFAALVRGREILFETIALDAVAGVVLAIISAVLGISAPGRVVEWISNSPPVGWTVLGALGPFVSRAVRSDQNDPDRARESSLEEMIDGDDYEEDPKDLPPLIRRLRSANVLRLVYLARHLDNIVSERRARWTENRVLDLLDARKLAADDLARHVRMSYERRPRLKMAKTVEETLSRWPNNGGIVDPALSLEYAKMLVSALVDAQNLDPISGFTGEPPRDKFSQIRSPSFRILGDD